MITTVLVLFALLLGLTVGWAGSRFAQRGGVPATDGLRDAFASVSAAALRANNDTFLALASERLAGQTERADAVLAQRQDAVATMLIPVREALEHVDEQLRTVESNRQRAYGGLVEQVESMRTSQDALRHETAQLVGALRAPQVRGRWGELQLRRVVEAAGALEHVHFREQVHTVSDAGPQRPDVIVDLAGGKQVVIDAKVPFDAWLRAMEATDDQQRTTLMRTHARHLREHVKALGDKAYWRTFPTTPEFVVLFVPADTFLDAALREDPGLQEDAFARDVVLATPSTLVALLRTIGFCWRSEHLAQNAAEISGLAAELYARLATVGDHVDALGGSLEKAVRSYNRAVGSLETRVLVSARKLADLEVSRDPLPAPRSISGGIRPISAPEWTGSEAV